MCTLLGYSIIISLFCSLLLLFLGIPVLCDSYYYNLVPKVNLWKEFFLFPFCSGISAFTFYCNVSFSYIEGYGYGNLIQGVKKRFADNLLLALTFSSPLLALLIYLITMGFNLIVIELILYATLSVIVLLCWIRFKTPMKNKAKKFLEQTSNKFEDKIIFKQGGSLILPFSLISPFSNILIIDMILIIQFRNLQ